VAAADRGLPDVDEAVPFPQKDFRGLRGAAKALRWGVQWNTARREAPEVVLDFQGLLRSGMISAARGLAPDSWLVRCPRGRAAFL